MKGWAMFLWMVHHGQLGPSSLDHTGPITGPVAFQVLQHVYDGFCGFPMVRRAKVSRAKGVKSRAQGYGHKFGTQAWCA